MSVNNQNVFLILGCFGQYDGDFIFCSGLENIILSSKQIKHSYHEIMDFFDNYGLFDQPMMDYNGVKNFLKLFKDVVNGDIVQQMNPVWGDRQMEKFYEFIVIHKKCRPFIKLDIKEPIKKEPKTVLIPANKSLQEKFKLINKLNNKASK